MKPAAAYQLVGCLIIFKHFANWSIYIIQVFWSRDRAEPQLQLRSTWSPSRGFQNGIENVQAGKCVEINFKLRFEHIVISGNVQCSQISEGWKDLGIMPGNCVLDDLHYHYYVIRTLNRNYGNHASALLKLRKTIQ